MWKMMNVAKSQVLKLRFKKPHELNRAVHRPKPVQNFVIRAGFFILFFEPGR